MFGLTVEGDAALRQFLGAVGPRIEEKVTVAAMRKAAAPIVQAARANAMKLGTRSVRRAATQMVQSLQRSVQRLNRSGKTKQAAAAIQRTIRRAQRMRGTPHQLARSIGIRVKRYTAQGIVYVAVGPRWPEGAHGHLVEFGHRTSKHRTGTLERNLVRSARAGSKFRRTATSRVTGRAGGGITAGFVPAHPFMRPAWDSCAQQALTIATQEHRALVEREAQEASCRTLAGRLALPAVGTT